MNELGILSKYLLRDLLADFIERKLGSDALDSGYEGLYLTFLSQRYVEEGEFFQVDLDLAVKELEKEKLAKTGPMAGYENQPGSGVIMLGSYSKGEYLILTENGYRAAQRPIKSHTQPPYASLHITGGSFSNSPIGVGAQVRQNSNYIINNNQEAVDVLLKLLAGSGKKLDEASRRDVERLVEAASKADAVTVKPIFHRLFGFAAGGIKEVAWSIVATLIAKYMGL